LGKGVAWGSQQKEQFTCPEQNIQQASTLKIAQAFALQADVECLSRTFLDESGHGGQVDGLSAEFAAPRPSSFS